MHQRQIPINAYNSHRTIHMQIKCTKHENNVKTKKKKATIFVVVVLIIVVVIFLLHNVGILQQYIKLKSDKAIQQKKEEKQEITRAQTLSWKSFLRRPGMFLKIRLEQEERKEYNLHFLGHHSLIPTPLNTTLFTFSFKEINNNNNK